MKKKQLILAVVILVFVLTRIIPLFIITPSQAVIAQIDPNQIGYIGLLKNSIIQLLLCLSLIIMLGGFIYVFSSLKTLEPGLLKNINTILLLIGILICISLIILWKNWAYIYSEFTALVTMLYYEAFNPRGEPNLNYYQWRYSPNPAKVIMGLLLIPLFIPFFYKLKKTYKNKKLPRR